MKPIKITAPMTRAALNDFTAKKAEIDKMLVRLANQSLLTDELVRLAHLSANHFDTHPEDITWSHVDALGLYANLLTRITDSAFGEGEHTEDTTK